MENIIKFPGNGEQQKEIGVEVKIEVLVLKNGVISVVAPTVAADSVRDILLRAFTSISEEIAVNRSLQLLDKYLKMQAENAKIIKGIKGN